jgi:xanthine/CO dehydrogenase XdhC/CoxF family maturation factor
MDENNTMTTALDTASQWLGQGRKIAMATVIETWGSAPQPVGSQLVVDADGNFEGAVSGGCVEGAVTTEAQDMIASGGHKVLSFGVADETAWKVGLACGGKIRVLVESVS